MKTFKKNVLHSGNILNNGYLQCKYLRSSGVAADCISIDYPHSQGQPEWIESRFDHALPEWNIDLSKIAKGFKRPAWYFQGSQFELSKRHIGSTNFLRRIIKATHARLSPSYSTRSSWSIEGRYFDFSYMTKNHVASLFEKNAQHFPERLNQLSVQDISDFYPRASAQADLMRQYPIYHGYALDSIYAMLCAPETPFICHEHGHLRDFPYENSARGRLYALSLKLAKKVIITNSDCISSAHQLGLDNTIFIPHLVDDDKFKPETSPFRTALLNEFDCDQLIVAPARHHWKKLTNGFQGTWTKGNDIIVKGVAKMLSQNPDLRIKLIFFEWGQEVEETKRLVSDFGLDSNVVWRPLCSKPVLKDYINASDVVLDQFNKYTGSFGAIVPESMACAKPVMINFNPEIHHWCYPELPPVCNASDEHSLAVELAKLLTDENYKNRIGQAGYDWYHEYHSSRIVTNRLIDVYREISDEIAH